jgi:DNA-binding response OmpR family regulator
MKKNLNILIVDDNLTFVGRVISMLEESGIDCHTNVASNSDEARRFFSSESHHVIVLDINLPGKNGIELLRLFRQSDTDPKVIMMTNHADSYYKQQCLELGAEYFLDKSNDFMQLPRIIRELFPVDVHSTGV